MEFRLIYKGPLPAASASDTRNQHKHRIRRELNKQLRVLWKENRYLKELEQIYSGDPTFSQRTPADVKADQYERCGKRFLPLINERSGLACALDILFLRRDNPGGMIISGGDLDNRLKVLFDALRIPNDCSELDPSWTPADDENPLYCLMEDDKLITKLTVITDHLILPLGEDDHRHDVFLVIHVTLKITDFDRARWEFLT